MATAELTLQDVQRYYDRGRYVEGHAAAVQAFGPLETWQGPEARILAMRLASNLGAGRLATSWCWRTWRAHPDHPLVQYYATRGMLSRRGPWRAREAVKAIGELRTDDRILRADWLALEGVLAGMFRDFAAADRALDAAEALAPESPWVLLERAEVLGYEDRHDEALAASQRTLAMRPWYRPGVQSTAHLLTMLNRDEEALELLRGAAEVLESGDILFQLSGMLLERMRYAEAREVIERIPALCPLMEKRYAEALSAQRSDAAYHCGDEAAAVDFARQAGKGFYDYAQDGQKRLWAGLAKEFPLAAIQPSVEEVKHRLMLIQSVETARCLEEKVLLAPIDADVGAILGWGFPAFLGGPIGQIHSLGVAAFVKTCEALAKRHGPRFAPPPLLRDMAASGKRFYDR